MSTDQNHIDCYIGNKLRERRKQMDLSQTDLADTLGLSYQQIQRYESGENALTANRLLQIAQVLKVQPAFFYEGAPVSPKPTEAQELTISGKSLRPLRVLFVDDSTGDEVLFRTAVQRYDEHIEIHCIREPERVVDFLLHHEKKYGQPRSDMVILDINMPKINGLELLKRIKSNALISDIPVVMLTNSIQVKEMKKAYESHASGFIQKTADFDAYCDDIRRTLEYWSHTVILPANHA